MYGPYQKQPAATTLYLITALPSDNALSDMDFQQLSTPYLKTLDSNHRQEAEFHSILAIAQSALSLSIIIYLRASDGKEVLSQPPTYVLHVRC